MKCPIDFVKSSFSGEHTLKKVGSEHYYNVAKFVKENREKILKIYGYVISLIQANLFGCYQ